MTDPYLIPAKERELTPTEIVYDQMAEDNGFELHVPREQPKYEDEAGYSLYKKGLPFDIMFEYNESDDGTFFDLHLIWNALKEKANAEMINDCHLLGETTLPDHLTRTAKNVTAYQKLNNQLEAAGCHGQYREARFDERLTMYLNICTIQKTEGPTDVKKLEEMLAVVNDFLKDGETEVGYSDLGFHLSKQYSDGVQVNVDVTGQKDSQAACTIQLFASTEVSENTKPVEGQKCIDEMVMALVGLKERGSRLTQDSFYKTSEQFTDTRGGLEFVYNLELKSPADLQKVLDDFNLEMKE
jgi:hypothetical protein